MVDTKSCMSLGTLDLGNHGTTVYYGHADFSISTVEFSSPSMYDLAGIFHLMRGGGEPITRA